MNNEINITELKELYHTNANANAVINNIESNTLEYSNDVIFKIGDFKIRAEDLGKLLKKFAEKEMPQILI